MNSLANLLKPFLLGFVLNFLKFKGPNQTFSFRIFRVLHTVQSLIFKVLCCSLSQTAHICYHKLFRLSRTFLKTFWSFVVVFSQQQLLYVSILFRICQQLFSSFYFAETHSLQRVLIISQLFLLVNNFLWLILFSCQKGKKIIIWKKEAEKEGFEPSRRFPDLHP